MPNIGSRLAVLAIALFALPAPVAAKATLPVTAELALSAGRDLENLVACVHALNVGSTAQEACGVEGVTALTFPTGWTLGAQQQALAQRLAVLMNTPAARRLKFQLVGHTSCGEAAQIDQRRNFQVALRRAKAVRRALARAGVVRSRLAVEGRGHFESLLGGSCEERGEHALERRVELAVSTPLAVGYGQLASRQVASLLAGGGRDAGPVIRFNPRGLHPRHWVTINLSELHNRFQVPVARALSGDCLGATTGWGDLTTPLSQLDRTSGDLAVRLRAVPRRIGGRIRTDLFLDLSGTSPDAVGSKGAPSLPGHWSIRERLPAALRQLFTGTTFRRKLATSEPDYVLASADGSSVERWGGLVDGVPVASQLVRGCGLQVAMPASENLPLDLGNAVSAALAAVPLSPEDVLARQLELNSTERFVRVEPGMRLCVRAPGISVGAGGNRFSFTDKACETVYALPLDQGHRALVIGQLDPVLAPATPASLPHNTTVDSSVLMGTRWSHLLDPRQSAGVYLFFATEGLPERTTEAFAEEPRRATFILGSATAQHSLLLASLLRTKLINIDGTSQTGWPFACGKLSVLTNAQRLPVALPGSYWYQSMTSDAWTKATSRCASIERAAEVVPELAVRTPGELIYVPLGTTLGGLAVHYQMSDKQLLLAASRSRGGLLIFGNAPASWSLEAARRLPLLVGDSIAW